MRKKFVKLFSFLMIFCLSFLFVGCSGPGGSSFGDDLFEKLENGEITEDEFADQMKENLDIPLYGTKLLYRSSSSNMGDMGTDYQDYYSKFSLWLSYYLIAEYGYYNYGAFNGQNVVDPAKFILDDSEYIYDTIRYQISDVSKISKTQKFIIGDNTAPKETIDDKDYTTSVSTNINNNWNWSFDINSAPISYINTNLEVEQPHVQFINPNTTEIFYNYRNYDIPQFKTNYPDYYNNNQILYNNYLTQMLINEDTKYMTDEYGNEKLREDIFENNIEKAIDDIAKNKLQSDMVKAIEYLLYCYSLNYKPNGITVDGQTVKIYGYNEVDDALEFIKERFDKHGAYIGFSEENKTQLVQDILNIVIGENAQKTNVVEEKTDMIANIYFADQTALDDNKPSYIELVESDTTQTTKVEVIRKYKDTIANIIDIAYTYVSIGENTETETREGNSLNINQRYLNSQMQDLWGNNFFLSMRFDGGDEFDPKYIPAREYQSALLMFSEEFSFDNIYVAVRYAGNNNLTEGYDFNQYIELNVNLNLYINGEWRRWGSERLKVPAGEFDAMEFEMQEGFSQVAKFSEIETKYRDEKYSDWGFSAEEGIKVGAFKPHVGGGILSQGMSNYSGKVQVGKPIKLLGTTAVKDYFKIVEPEENELEANQFYSSARFAHEKMVGANLCDYVEITYDVIKTSGDFNTNYSFQTGIYMFM